MSKRIYLTILFSASCHIGVLASNPGTPAPRVSVPAVPKNEPAPITYVVTLLPSRSAESPPSPPQQVVPPENPVVTPSPEQVPKPGKVQAPAPVPEPLAKPAPNPLTEPLQPPHKQLAQPTPRAAPPATKPSTESPAVADSTAQPPALPVPVPQASAAEPARSAPVAPPAQADDEEELGRYLAAIKARIEAHKFYPAAARRRGLEGSVAISFVVDETGAIRDVRLEGAHRLLTSAVQRALEDAAPFAPPPTSASRPLSLAYTISFHLNP